MINENNGSLACNDRGYFACNEKQKKSYSPKKSGEDFKWRQARRVRFKNR